MKKAKILSIILAAMMVLAMLPQCVLAADVNITAFDNALGNLADKGQKYVTDGALPTSVGIDGTTYTVTYVSTNEGVITSTGKVNHGLSFAYVTVTPQISVAGNTVSGTSQELIVMPMDSTTALFDDFENFDAGSLIGKEASALNGWSLNSSCDSNYVRADIVSDPAQSKYLKFELYKKGLSSNPQMAKSFSGSDEGKTIISMRLNLSPWTNKPNNNVYIFPLAEFNWYESMYGRNDTKTADKIFTVRTWQEFIFVIDNENVEKVDGNVYKKADVYIDGVLKADDFPLKEWNDALTLRIFRNNVSDTESQYIYMDDVMVLNVAAPEIKLADKGEKYVTADSLPTSVTLGGEEYGLTYTSDKPNVIAANGKVNHGISVEYVTVTPQLNAGGAVISCAPQKLIVMPSGNVEFIEDFESDAFSIAEGQTEKTLDTATTHNGWTVGYKNGSTVKVKNGSTSKFLQLDSTSSSDTAANAKKALSVSEEGITVFAFRGSIYTASQGHEVALYPYALAKSSNSYTQYQLRATASSETTTNVISTDPYATEPAHDFVFVRTNSATPENVVTTVYVDGKSVGSFSGDSGQSKSEFNFWTQRYKGNCLMLDDIIVMNVSIDDIKIADKGNSYVVGDSLPKTVMLGTEQCNVTYASDNPDVIDAEGNVTHSDSFVYVDVTPTVTFAGSEFVCKTQKLLVMPVASEELLFEDFEDFDEGTVARGAVTDGWTVNAYSNEDETTLKVVNDAVQSKYLHMEVFGTNNTGTANPTMAKTYTGRNTGLTVIGMKMFAGITQSSQGLTTPIGRFNYTNEINGGNGTKLVVNEGYNTAWHNFLFVVDNKSNINGCKDMTVYVDGVELGKINSDAWSDQIWFMLYRGNIHKALIDDIFVFALDNSDYIIKDLVQTNTHLTGYTVTKQTDRDETVSGYAVVYDADGKLKDVDKAVLNFVGKTATVNDADLSFTDGILMKLFVWNDALVPVAEKVERALQLETPTLHLIGDSTVCNWTTTNKHGWGTYIEDEFNPGSVEINNRAVSGKSAKTFMDEGYFDLFSGNIKSGDVLIIQLGTNDKGYNVALDEYQSYLEQYVDIARKKGAYPVLVTLPTQIDSIDNGILTDSPSSVLNLTLADYCEVINNVASEKNVPMIDLYTAMGNVYSSVGSETFKTYYVDQIHFSESGAKLIAGIVADGIKNAQPALYIADKVK